MAIADGRIAHDDLVERMRHFIMTTYLATSDVMSAGVITVAAGVALEIAANQQEWGMKAMLWIASIFLFAMIHAFWRLGTLMTSWRSGILDHLNPLILGLFELAQFLVLSRQFGAHAFWLVWAFLVGAQALSAFFFVNNRLSFSKGSDQYADDAREFAASYLKWMREGRLGMAVWSLVVLGAAAAGVLLARSDPGLSKAVVMGTAVVSAVASLAGLWSASHSQERFQRALFETKAGA
jgi:hypothetical protein